MIIQANSGADRAAQAFPNLKQNPSSASAAPASSASAPALQQTPLSQSEGVDRIDAATATQTTEALTASMFNDATAILNAHAGLNPQIILNLLQ